MGDLLKNKITQSDLIYNWSINKVFIEKIVVSLFGLWDTKMSKISPLFSSSVQTGSSSKNWLPFIYLFFISLRKHSKGDDGVLATSARAQVWKILWISWVILISDQKVGIWFQFCFLFCFPIQFHFLTSLFSGWAETFRSTYIRAFVPHTLELVKQKRVLRRPVLIIL